MLWVTSDLHFHHENLVMSGLRPPDYEKKIIKSWNGQVKDTDTVIILGDISWRNDYEVIGKLRGRKILVRGNHDKKSCESYLKYFDFACETFSMQYNGLDIIFSHKPLKTFTQDLNIHGHLHNNTHRTKESSFRTSKHLLISLELMGYGVFSLPALVKNWKRGITK